MNQLLSVQAGASMLIASALGLREILKQPAEFLQMCSCLGVPRGNLRAGLVAIFSAALPIAFDSFVVLAADTDQRARHLPFLPISPYYYTHTQTDTHTPRAVPKKWLFEVDFTKLL